VAKFTEEVASRAVAAEAGGAAPRPPKVTRWRLMRGLADVLQATADAKLEEHVKLWKDEIARGEIGEETRQVVAALHWITSLADSRLEGIPDSPAAEAPAVES
jgi:hypothetical protein